MPAISATKDKRVKMRRRWGRCDLLNGGYWDTIQDYLLSKRAIEWASTFGNRRWYRKGLWRVLPYLKHRYGFRKDLDIVGVDVVFWSVFDSAETFFFDPGDDRQGWTPPNTIHLRFWSLAMYTSWCAWEVNWEILESSIFVLSWVLERYVGFVSQSVWKEESFGGSGAVYAEHLSRTQSPNKGNVPCFGQSWFLRYHRKLHDSKAWYYILFHPIKPYRIYSIP